MASRVELRIATRRVIAFLTKGHEATIDSGFMCPEPDVVTHVLVLIFSTRIMSFENAERTTRNATQVF